MSPHLPRPRPGDPSGGLPAAEPGLDALLGLLTAGPTPDELAGEKAALAMFRAAGPACGGSRGSGTDSFAAGAARPRPGRARWLAAAVSVAAAAGFAVAAYTEALPAPLQHVAYSVLGFAGVPDAHHAPPAASGSHPAGRPGPASARGPSHAARSPRLAGWPASPRPGVSGLPSAAGLSVTVASGTIAAGTSDSFTGLLTEGGRGVAGADLTLIERRAGQPAWQVAGNAVTGSGGVAVVTVADLTTNGLFAFTGPGRELSRPVSVTVLPPVSASFTAGPPGQGGTLVVSSPLAFPGDAVVLQVQARGGWLSMQQAALDDAGRAGFVVGELAMGRTYRVILLPTAAHGLSVSNPVSVPPRER